MLPPAWLQAEAQRRVRIRQVDLEVPSKIRSHLYLQHWNLPEPDADTSLDTSLYAWQCPYLWIQTAHLASNSCQVDTSDVNSSFDANSDLFEVEGLFPLHKWLRSVISGLSVLDGLVLKQILHTEKCHWVKQCSERNWKQGGFTEIHDFKIHSYPWKVIMWLWNPSPLVGILLQTFLSSKKEVWFLWFIMV